jgi:glycosyltransferase involved in cell wall biosynthesis
VNVAWLSSDPLTQGALGVTARIEGARFLRRAGHRVTMVCGGAPGSRPIEDVDTRLIDSPYTPFLAWRRLWPGVRKHLAGIEPRPDVVISDFALLPPAFRWVRSAGRSGSRPGILLDIRSHPVEAGPVRLSAQRARFAATLRMYGRRVDAVSTITPALRDHVARLSRLPSDRVTVWTSGCTWCDEPDRPAGWPPELEANVRDRFVVVYHGSLSRGRGLFEAVEAIDRVQPTIPSIVLLLLGGGSARGDLHRLTERRGLGDHVRFVDPVPLERVPEFLSAADVGLAPWPPTWDMEANNPLKLNEYLCHGLPVILTTSRPHRVVPAGAPFAFWASDGSPADLAEAMQAAYQCRERLPELGRAAREWARPRLGWSAQFEILANLLVTIASGSRVGESAVPRGGGLQR